MFRKFPIDNYMVLLIATVFLATALPVSGLSAKVVAYVSYGAVALLFFIYGAKLETKAVWESISNWRLQALIFLTTYLLFPLLGLGLTTALEGLLKGELVTGILFLTILPSTVQSSIALTGLANGNVPAAICAASVSNMAGVVITPLLAALLLSGSTVHLDSSAAISICVQLLFPFIAGQMARPLVGRWVEKNKRLTLVVDRGSILLIVYSAFSAGVVAGIWGRLDAITLTLLIATGIGLLMAAMLLIILVGRFTGLEAADQTTFLFCGAQKSLASGVPIANILFAGHSTSMVILPLMIYHQFQLFLSVAIAQRKSAAGRTPVLK
ncbi:bile acid:sodium symporter family protein [Mesorhizobium sp. 1B3]|uniref:bile acid:sodium symporter family protein n=1 Tax=Mesorhizobium sp. 1B3 TaxID=3243599 RepID=UPI003D96A78F